ncbi:MAG: 30S ribosome-binding factor RbfA [Candidatus Caenarcaniphilales bacterium]|nr:30S ribosome-binding factor RbfA [Candidatus Caenarcaniphilales bacterium]
MGRPSFSRGDRLASSIQEEVADLIKFRKLKEFKDPRFDGLISITEVKVKNGYNHLDIYWSVLEDNKAEDILSVLKEAIPSIRGHICRKCKLRFAPTINFHLDDSIKRGCEILSKLDRMNDESAGSNEDEKADAEPELDSKE